MAYLITPRLIFPVEQYKVNGVPFGKRSVIEGILWGLHLGEDCVLPAGTDVRACGRGTVVYAALHPGSEEKGNWGHIIIIRHKHAKTRKVFYSVYAHLGTSFKRIGEKVECGEPIGFVGEGFTSENGFWEAHLHFAIYTGPWKNDVLPGYWKEGEKRTRPEWWQSPSEFIKNYKNL
ncbi:MAG: M23 family metallopeptidase [bacterium]|nr:M23 family metallopeptidase [bacterium]